MSFRNNVLLANAARLYMGPIVKNMVHARVSKYLCTRNTGMRIIDESDVARFFGDFSVPAWFLYHDFPYTRRAICTRVSEHILYFDPGLDLRQSDVVWEEIGKSSTSEREEWFKGIKKHVDTPCWRFAHQDDFLNPEKSNSRTLHYLRAIYLFTHNVDLAQR